MIVVPLTLGAVQGAVALLKADDLTFASLQKQIDSIPTSTSLNEFVDSVVTKADADQSRIARVFEFLVQILHQRNTMIIDPLTAEEFAELALRSVKVTVQNLSFSDQEAQRFTSFVSGFLTGKGTLGLTAKANQILTQNEKNFFRARIISEIRPIFDDDDQVNPPIASVINHQLKIEYLESMVRKEFFVGLDTGELLELKQAVARAEKKTKELIQLLDKANLPYIDVPGDEVK